MNTCISTIRSKPICLVLPIRALVRYFLRNVAKEVGVTGVSGLSGDRNSHFLSLKKRSSLPFLVLIRNRTFPAPHWKILSMWAFSRAAISVTTERTSKELISFFMPPQSYPLIKYAPRKEAARTVDHVAVMRSEHTCQESSGPITIKYQCSFSEV